MLHLQVTPPIYTSKSHLQVTQMLPQITSGYTSVSKIPMQPPKLHSNVTPPSYTQMLHLQVTQMLPQITSGYTSVSKIPKQPPKILYTSHFTSIPTQWPAADKKILCPPLSARFLSNHPSYNQASNYVQRLLVAAHKTVLQLKWNLDSPDPDKILGQIIINHYKWQGLKIPCWAEL